MSPCATPATQNAMPATQSGAAPRATNGDQRRPSAPPSATSATPATPNAGRCLQVPRLPRKTTVNVTKCHACHAKWRDQVQQVPRLPRQTQVDVSKGHACHAKRRWMSLSATPATQSGVAPRATNGDQVHHQVQQVPHLPLQTQVDVSKCHACHVIATSATPATPNAGRCLQVPRLLRKVARRPANGDQRRPSAPPTPTCTTPATQNEGTEVIT